LIVPETPISFDRYVVPRGLQPGETPLPEEQASSNSTLPPLNEHTLAQLQEMGFSAISAEKALRMTGNDNVDIATGWLIEHMDDPDIDVPFNITSTSSITEIPVDPENMTYLMGMGFDERMAKKALQETVPPFNPSAYKFRVGILNVQLIGYFLIPLKRVLLDMRVYQRHMGFRVLSCIRDLRFMQVIMLLLYARRFLVLREGKIGCCSMMRKLLEEEIGMRFIKLDMYSSSEEFNQCIARS
jgi:UBA/TS-N domain